MNESRLARALLRLAALAVLVFMYAPLVVIALYAFNRSNVPSWPIHDYSTRWVTTALHDTRARDALVMSLEVAAGATAVALVLGSCAAFALGRFRFFGRESVSFLLVLPIALPGIVTGIALLSAMDFFGLVGSYLTIVVGHATFCIVVVYNNALARLRRTSRTLEEASMDLGADGWQTFRHVTLPGLSSALLAGALLALALSFDEVVVTYFTAGAQETLPLWIFNQFRLPNKAPEVNAVALFMILVTALPVYVAQRLMRETGGLAGR
jgi:putative spermidine/putrescine transport system permease protein